MLDGRLDIARLDQLDQLQIGLEPEPGGHKYAIELLQQVTNMNNGIYLEEDLKNAVKTNFCIGVAGYPEKHFEAPNMQTDLAFLKAKVDAGAEYIVTQMFFDNQKFFSFVQTCRDAGIHVPIIPGLKPITTKKQLNIIPRTFHVDIPEELSNEIMKCKTDAEVEIVGTEWLLKQSKELKAAPREPESWRARWDSSCLESLKATFQALKSLNPCLDWLKRVLLESSPPLSKVPTFTSAIILNLMLWWKVSSNHSSGFFISG